MSTPKRRRTAPCPCILCKGQERDYRTIKSHEIRPPPSTTLTSDESMPDSPLLPPHELPRSPIEDDHDTDDQNSPQPQAEKSFRFEISESRVLEYIMNEVTTKLNRGDSRTAIEEHLKNTAKLLGKSVDIPTKWSDVVAILKKLGYKNPQHYKVCVDTTHSKLLKNKRTTPECPLCQRKWDDCIDYYCLGLNIQDWFVTDSSCDKLMSHWQDKDTWFTCSNDDDSYNEKTELWHGERFRQLSYFWDSSKTTLLPERCSICSKIIPSSTIANHQCTSNNVQIQVKCPHCQKKSLVVPRYMKGDPRNQAILIHEDGWNPHNHWGGHSISTITITHGCMNKLERSDGSNALVYSFIPNHQLPRQAPHKYDGFFEALIEELENVYIDGEEVFFKSQVDDHSPESDIATIRVIPLLITADSKAHAEIGLTTAGGHKGCRRCFVSGTYISEKRHYYYGNFRERYRFPASRRTVEENREFGKAVDMATTAAEKRRLVKQNGVTGEAIFYRLYDLCQFDPIQDMVIDVMHALLLNLIKSELEHHLLGEMGQNAEIEPEQRDPKNGGLLKKKVLMKALEEVNWTKELKDGRVPKISEASEKLGGWTAEEFGKFILIAPFILRKIIPKKAYESIYLLHTAYCMVFSKRLRIQGWSKDNTETLRKILWRHAIIYEELYGLSACTENVVNSLHMTEDIKRHGPLDNYWCFMYERKVKYYKRQTTNMRSMCKTFAEREAQLSFSNTYVTTHPPQEALIANQNPIPVPLIATAIDDAILLKEQIEDTSDDKYLEDGILIGQGHQQLLSRQQQADISYWLRKFEIEDDKVYPSCLSYSKVLKVTDFGTSVVFRTGENAMIRDYDHSDREWVITIEKLLLYGPVAEGKFFKFLQGKFYVAKDTDIWTGQRKIQERTFKQLCVQPLKLLDRKVILSKCSGNNYLTVDLDKLIDIEEADIIIPHYPEICEIVSLHDDKLFFVEEVNGVDKKAKGYKMTKIGGQHTRYKKVTNITEISIAQITRCVNYTENAGCFYIEDSSQ